MDEPLECDCILCYNYMLKHNKYPPVLVSRPNIPEDPNPGAPKATKIASIETYYYLISKHRTLTNTEKLDYKRHLKFYQKMIRIETKRAHVTYQREIRDKNGTLSTPIRTYPPAKRRRRKY